MMDSIQAEVYTALSGTGYTVLYLYPQGAANVPCVTWRESNNREYGQADGVEFVTEVEYTIDCWAMTPEATATMASAVDTALAALRLKRTFSHDLYEQDTRVHRKNMRYRALIRLDEQKIYQ
jgi:hypothetical protein